MLLNNTGVEKKGNVVNFSHYSSEKVSMRLDELEITKKVRLAITNAQKEEKQLALLYFKCSETNRNQLPFSWCNYLNEGNLALTGVGEYFDKEQKYDLYESEDAIYVIISGLYNIYQIESCVAQINKAVKMQNAHFGLDCGCSIYPFDGTNEYALMGNAKTAAQRAQTFEHGYSNIEYFSNATNIDNREFVIWNGMKDALERDGFEVFYQPKVDGRTGKIVGLEALIRWYHPDIGVIEPDEFIAIAEESGDIIPIGEWVLQTVCEQSVYWESTVGKTLPIAVNLSARQFKDNNLVRTIERIIRNTGISPEKLEIELTESQDLNQYQYALEKLYQIKRLGVRITLDDFGTGYSSLSYLKHLPIDTVKIDKSFIKCVNKGVKENTILKTMIRLMNALNFKVIAEGVETIQQVNFLLREKCTIMQGYYFWEPLLADEITKLLNFNHLIEETDIPIKISQEERLDSIYQYLDSFGIKHSYKGYRYLLLAIQSGLNNPSILSNLRGVYSAIAEQKNTKSINVKRDIRYAIMPLNTTSKQFISTAVSALKEMEIGGKI